jgi:two-component system, LytTR family, sensor histidine kinase AlgZ
MTSNPQFSQAHADAHAVCSLSMALRVLAAVNGLLLFAVLLVATGWRDGAARFLFTALWLEPASLLSMAALCLAVRRGALSGLGFASVVAALCFVLAGLSQLLHHGFSLAGSAQAACVGACLGAAGWYALHRARAAQSPALQEADLRSLGAAMRPHFFFNALNAVMGLIRVNPRRAEDLLQDTAELFRDVMAQDQRRLVTLQTELDTTQRYARVELARLEQRLTLRWDIEPALLGAVLPPFALQLLVENAVRHGIEPLPLGGEVAVSVARHEQRLKIMVSNPVLSATLNAAVSPTIAAKAKTNPAHNGIALDNLRQRLMLLYDQAADLDFALSAGHYCVTLTLPLEFEA